MHLEQTVPIAAPIESAWEFLLDLDAVGRCVPGAERLEVKDADTVHGAIRIKVGPIGLVLNGVLRFVERDPVAKVAEVEIRADDRRIGAGVTARTSFRLASTGEGASTLTMVTDATLTGRLGQFGQPIIRRKADELIRDFAANVAAALQAPRAG